MIELVNHINTVLASKITGKYYGLAKLVLDDKGEQYPRTLGIEATKITPNDRYNYLSYFRAIDTSIEDSEEFSFGRSPSRMNSQSVRMVILVDMRKDPEEMVIGRVIEFLPDKILNENYKYAAVSSEITLIRDSQAIWEAEWGNAYKDKYQMRYNIYALEYTLDFIACDNCVNTCQTA